MDRHRFSLLIGQLEREADDHPRLYAGKVAAVAALGYLIIALVAVLILAAGYFALVPLVSGRGFNLQLAILAGVGILTLAAMARALWVKLEEPGGRQLTPEETPKLFALIAEVCDAMGGVPVHSVRLSSEFNASIVQIPKWGVFGNYRNHLEIGLPLLIALSLDEFQAVLAHEFGHLSAHHGKFSAWIYRQRVTWHALESRFREPSNLFEQLLARFYGWYAPYFYAYSFVLARKHEYEADQAAAFVTNDASLARALTKVELMSRFLSEVFWKRLYAQIERAPQPPYPPYSLMPRAFKVAEKEWTRPQWLKESLQRLAADDDTHPSLAERLAALDVPPSIPAFDVGRSALALLAPSSQALVKYFDGEWLREFGPQWREQHESLKQTRAKLSELERYREADLSAQQLWEKAGLLLEVDLVEDAIDTLSILVSRPERLPKAHMLLGHLLLSRSEDRGLEHLLSVAQQDKELALEAARTGYMYLEERVRRAEANRFWSKAQEAQAA